VPPSSGLELIELPAGVISGKTIAAVDRFVAPRLERNGGLFSAGGAGCLVLLAGEGPSGLAFLGGAAGAATAGLVCIALKRVEFLVFCGKLKAGSAVSAS